MFRSAGNPYVAAAKANLWSQSTQEVLNEWEPFGSEDEEKKERCQQELDSFDRRRGELVGGVDDPRRRNQDSKLIKADKNMIKRLHEIVVFNKTESDRKRRLEKRGGGVPPDHYMKGLPVPLDETSPGPEYEAEPNSPVQSFAFDPPPPRSRFRLFRIFSRRKNQIASSPDVPREMSFEDASPLEHMVIMNEDNNPEELKAPESITSHAGQYNTYPGRNQDKSRGIHDEPKVPPQEKHPRSSSRHPGEGSHDRRKDDPRRDDSRDHRKHDKYDDRDRYPTSSNRHDNDKYSRSREVQSSSQRRSDKDRSRHGDENYSSRHRSSRRRPQSEDEGDGADRDRRRHKERDRDRYRERDHDRHRDKDYDRRKDKDYDRYKDKDYDRHKDRDHDRHKGKDHDRYRERDHDRYRDKGRDRDRGVHEESQHRMHKSEGHQKSRSGTEQPRPPSHHSVAVEDHEEAPPPEPPAEDAGDILSVSEQLHGSLNVGDA